MARKSDQDHIKEILDRNDKFSEYEDLEITRTPGKETRIRYTCRLHGRKNMTVYNAEIGRGCANCKGISVGRRLSIQRSLSRDQVMEKAAEHGHSISRIPATALVARSTRVELECKRGHKWSPIIAHIRGCPECQKLDSPGFYNSTTLGRDEVLRNKPCSIYYIKFSKDSASYYKVGLDTTGRRWGSTIQGWSIEELFRSESTLDECFRLEQSILNKYSDFRGWPDDLEDIGGHTEMFIEDVFQGEYDAIK